MLGVRPYRPGLWIRFVAPTMTVVFVAATVAAWVGRSPREDHLSGLLVAISAFWLVMAVIGVRQSLIGIWCTRSGLVIRDLLRSRAVGRGAIVGIEARHEGARIVGGADCPVVVLGDGAAVRVRNLARSSPYLLGGSNVDDIVAGVCGALHPRPSGG